MIKLDLKDAYFCVPIHKDHQQYFHFQWLNSIREFSCLPFGYRPAPRRFTKLFRPVLAFLRKMGMRLVIYIDDIIILNQSCMALLQDRDMVVILLQCLGFVINWTKSQLEPTQSLEYLGFPVNSVLMTLALPEQKVENSVLNGQSLSIRQISELVGMLTASVQAVLPAPPPLQKITDGTNRIHSQVSVI